jgi:hypothetical protein
MLRRWILSFEAADSHQSSARCVGQGLEGHTAFAIDIMPLNQSVFFTFGKSENDLKK